MVPREARAWATGFSRIFGKPMPSSTWCGVFAGTGVAHISGTVDPASDMETIDTELLLADLETLTRAVEKAERTARTAEPDAIAWLELVRQVEAEVSAGRVARDVAGDARATHQTGCSSATYRQTHHVRGQCIGVRTPRCGRGGAGIGEGCGRGRSGRGHQCDLRGPALAELPAEDRELFLDELGLSESALDRMIDAAYGLLRLLTFYTVNEKEAHAWTVPEGATAYDAAGRIHTDFQRGFIRAEVVPVDLFLARGGEHGARESGELRLEGRGYRVAAGDVIKFRFNV